MICFKPQIRRSLEDFLIQHKLCRSCQVKKDRHVLFKEIPFHQQTLKVMYEEKWNSPLDHQLFIREKKLGPIYILGLPIIEMTLETYIGLVLNMASNIFLERYLPLDDMEILEYHQCLNIIENRNPNVL
jgi:hypothetical protein